MASSRGDLDCVGKPAHNDRRRRGLPPAVTELAFASRTPANHSAVDSHRTRMAAPETRRRTRTGYLNNIAQPAHNDRRRLVLGSSVSQLTLVAPAPALDFAGAQDRTSMTASGRHPWRERVRTRRWIGWRRAPNPKRKTWRERRIAKSTRSFHSLLPATQSCAASGGNPVCRLATQCVGLVMPGQVVYGRRPLLDGEAAYALVCVLVLGT